MSVRGFRDSFRSYTPIWLQNRQDSISGKLLNVGYRMLFSMIFPLDVAVQTMVEGLKAAWPGVGTPTANLLIGQSRGLLQGEAESSAAFAVRAVNWLNSWAEFGEYPTEELAREIQAYLANGPAVSVVDRSGHWTLLTSVADGSVASEVNAPWDWDSVSNPERATIWSDYWIIVYPCEWAQQPTFEARKAFDHTDGFGIGCEVQRVASDAILSLVALRKGAHTTVRAIIWSYDPTLCVPGGSNNPDGNWGCWSKPNGVGPAATATRVPARNPNARYTTHTVRL